MIQNRSPKAAVEQILKRTDAFYRRHETDAAVRRTYGYFTHHPIAPLNRRRLRHLLDDCQVQSEKLKRPLRILDLACGGGLITCAMASMGHRSLGLDLNADEI